MIPLALKIFLMEQNKFSQYFLILTALLLLPACQHSLIEERSVSLNKIEFGSNIQNSLRQKSKKYFIQDSSSTNLSLKFVDLNFKKKNFYGGLGARAKQIEIRGLGAPCGLVDAKRDHTVVFEQPGCDEIA